VPSKAKAPKPAAKPVTPKKKPTNQPKREPKNRPKNQVAEASKLRALVAKELGIPAGAVELRALRDLAASLGLGKPAEKAAPAPAAKKPSSSYLPQRLYLAMDGRGLDGRGMAFEVIDLPCLIGSSKRASVWINSPQIETNHLQITQSDDGWLLEDLKTEHGTFMGEKRIQKRVLEDGDEFKLAGYLRLRAELR
jgi:hypothetical protein